MNGDGSGLRRLTRGDVSHWPIWSPNGRRIAFVRVHYSQKHPSGLPEVWVMNADGSGQRRLARGRFVEEYQNGRDNDAFDELVHPEFVDLSPDPGAGSDREAARKSLESFFEGFPDSAWTIDDMIAEGDRVATKKTFTGTHTGDYYGIPPTGKRVTLQYVDILRVRDGKVVEHWYAMDQLSFMQQLGVVPSEHAGA